MEKLEREGRVRIEEGALIPDLLLFSTQGRLVSLKGETKEHHVVLFFYPGDGEGLRYPELIGCTAEACAFRDHAAKLKALGAVVFGVNLHPTRRQEEFVKREHLNFELLSDVNKSLVSMLGIPLWRSPSGEEFVARTTLIIKRRGSVVRVFDNVDPAHHIEEVITVLEKVHGDTVV